MSNDKCEHPELRPKDGKCSEQLVKECHGDQVKHPCNCNQHKQEK
jgi:hypothetical protein